MARGMAAGGERCRHDTGGRREGSTVGRETLGAGGERSEVRRPFRVDEVAPQTVKNHEDHAFHAVPPDAVMIVITTDAHAAHDPATMAPSPSGRPFYDRAVRVDQLLGAVH